MSTLATLEAEIADLRKEVASLREQADLFFTVHRDEDGTILDTQLRCWMLQCEVIDLRARDASESSGMIGIDDDGPCLSLFGQDHRARALLRVTDDSGEFEILGPDHHPVVRLFEQDGHGHLAALSPGNVPRAIMKGMENGGAITAVNEKGEPRAVLHSNDGNGGVAIVRDGHTAAEIIANEGGGQVTVRDAAGKLACLLGSNPVGNTLLIRDPQGEVGISIASTPSGNAIAVGRQSPDPKENGAVIIADLPNLGGAITIHDAEGRRAIDLSSDENGGTLQVLGPEHGSRAHLHLRDGGGQLTVSNAQAECVAMVSAPTTGGFLTATGPGKTAAIVTSHAEGASFALRQDEHNHFFVGPGAEQRRNLFLFNQEDVPVVQLFTAPQGGHILAAGNDGIVQAGLGASDSGGQATIFNELGVERGSLRNAQDGGGLHLKWGGTTGLIAAATERGGLYMAHGPDGEIVEMMPDEDHFRKQEDED